MNETAARLAVMTVIEQIVTDWTDYTLVVEPENHDVVNQATQVNPYLKVWIDFLGADQLDLGPTPREMQSGQVMLHVVAKCGTGTKSAAALRDFIRPYLSLKNLSGLQCHAAELYKPKEIKGWEHFPILVNFYYHS